MSERLSGSVFDLLELEMEEIFGWRCSDFSLQKTSCINFLLWAVSVEQWFPNQKTLIA